MLGVLILLRIGRLLRLLSWLTRTWLTRTRLTRTRLTRTRLTRTWLTRTWLTGGNLAGDDLSGCRLTWSGVSLVRIPISIGGIRLPVAIRVRLSCRMLSMSVLR
ncbi:MAG: pentapeptide repeat-containing protein [Rhodopirellula sp.]|nr:pentapeptide repeat-containing protein [Rhodopirellula sp.]